MNDRKVSGEQLRTGPLGSFESRIKTCPWADEISMHSPLPTLRLALRQTSPLSLKSATVIVFPISENDLKESKAFWQGYRTDGLGISFCTAIYLLRLIANAGNRSNGVFWTESYLLQAFKDSAVPVHVIWPLQVDRPYQSFHEDDTGSCW